MNIMKNKFITIAILSASAALLGGCKTTRTASYTDHDYNTVFKSAVSGLCSEKKLLVYKADKAKGIIWVQSRGMFANPPETPVMLVKGANGTTTASVTLPGMNNPWADRMMGLISSRLPAVTKSAGDKTFGGEPDLNLEKQKLELEKEKLKFEKEKLEFEKQKRKGR